MRGGLRDRLAQLAGAYGEGEPVPLAARSDCLVVRVGDVVAKAHAPGTDPQALARRLRIATALDGVLLAPLPLPDGKPLARVGDRLVTIWPAGTPVDPDEPDAAPWQRAANLLARLHAARPPGAAPPGPAAPDAVSLAGVGLAGIPPHGAPARVARAMQRLSRQADGHPAAAAVRAAHRTLPGWTYGDGPAPAGRPRTLVHGDWHLGQLVRVPRRGWRLVDVDDLGYGDPIWDLARPAAWYATGLMSSESWHEFLATYRRARGPAVPPDGDPWLVAASRGSAPATERRLARATAASELDAVAGALVVQTAALAVAAAVRQRRDLDVLDEVLVETCRRLAKR